MGEDIPLDTNNGYQFDHIVELEDHKREHMLIPHEKPLDDENKKKRWANNQYRYFDLVFDEKMMQRNYSWISTIRAYVRQHQHTIRKLILELTLVWIVYLIYQLGYKLAGGRNHKEIAMQNARLVIETEMSFGIFIEVYIQDAFRQICSPFWIQVMNAFYMGAHVPCTMAFFLWAALFHQDRYPRVRNGFIISHAITVFIEAIFPCAPPRLFPRLGWVDTILVYTETHLLTVEQRFGVNPYAAMPSMHFEYAFIVGMAGYWLATSKIAKGSFIGYLLLVTLGVVVTGNHFLADCIVGGAVVVFGYIMSLWIVPWTWHWLVFTYTRAARTNRTFKRLFLLSTFVFVLTFLWFAVITFKNYDPVVTPDDVTID